MKPHLVALVLIFVANAVFADEKMVCSAPIKPNEVRVTRYDFGNGLVVHIRTSHVLEILMYDKDGKTILSRQIETILHDTKKERLTQVIFINGDSVYGPSLERADKKTQILTTEIYNTAGSLLYSYQSSTGKPDVFRNPEGKVIDKKQIDLLYPEGSQKPIDIAKRPIHVE